MKRWLLLLLLPAMSLDAAPLRVRVYSDGATVTITGIDADVVRAADVRRVGNVIEVREGGDVTVPRTAVVEWVATGRSTATVRNVAALRIDAAAGRVEASGVRGNVEGRTANANVTARDVGGNVIVATGNGNVTADGVRGLVDVTTGNGKTFISNVASGVHVVSINGTTQISCVGGAVAVEDTSGRTTVMNVAGDVAIFTALGQASYDGALHAGRSYRLRTLDGAVSLAYASGGFTAQVASDAARPQRRVVRSGDESARVVLDAVGGRVDLRKSTNARRACR